MNKRQITDLVDQSIQINTHCFVVTADNRYILVCGFWDKSFRVYSTETGWFCFINKTCRALSTVSISSRLSGSFLKFKFVILSEVFAFTCGYIQLVAVFTDSGV